MNKRQEQKERTRQLLLATAKDLFIQKGFLGTTTAEIANCADVAHGTLFLHFNTKESLILAILDDELDTINKDIHLLIANSSEFQHLLKKYLLMIEKSEDLFAVLARETPFYSDELRRKLLFRESIIRSHFHDTYRQGVELGIYRDLECTIVLGFFFSTVNYLLANRKMFTDTGSVIAKFRDSILVNFTALISK